MLKAPPAGTTRSYLAATWALFASLALLMLGNGLGGSLLGVRAELEGFPTVVTGIVMAGYYIGFLAGSIVAPRIAWSVGHIRVYAGLASLASTAVLIHLVFVVPATWFVMRLVTGLCIAGLYVVAEAWLNGISTNASRGKLLSTYMVVVMGGLGAGQLLLGVDDPGSFELFILASVLVSLAVVPISLARIEAPRVELPSGLPIRELTQVAPLGVTGALLAGVGGGAIVGMGAVYASTAGLSVQRVGVFLGLMMIGGIALQWPLGALSDRYPRRWAILIASGGAGVMAFLAAGLDPASPLLLVAGFLFGGLSFPLYSLALSHVNDVIPVERMMAAGAAMVFLTGAGSIAGPPLASVFIDRLGPAGFWVLLATAYGGFTVYTAYRLVRRRQIDTVGKPRPWMHVPIRSSVVLGAMLRPVRRRNSRNGHGGRDGASRRRDDASPEGEASSSDWDRV